jgi:hypothetical protein
MPGFGGDTSGSDYVRQFFRPVLDQAEDALFRSIVHA